MFCCDVRFVTSGHVQTVLYNDISTETPFCAFKCRVTPSQRLNNAPHEAWIYLAKDTASVYCAHCTCMAGLGEVCSHVAATLFKVEMAVKLGLNKAACTDEACQWNRTFRKQLDVNPISEQLHLFKGRRKLSVTSTAASSNDPLPSDDVLFSLKAACPKAAFFSTIPKLDPDETDSASEVEETDELPQLLTSLYKESYGSLSPSELAAVAKERWAQYCQKFTVSQVAALEKRTRSQSVCPLWFEHRKGRVTGSRVHDVLTLKANSSADNLVRLITGCKTYDLSRNAAVKWGITNEEKARNQYIADQTPLHEHLQCTIPGFTVDNDFPFLGASPDGLITCACCGQGVLEIKCPFKHRDSTIFDAVHSDSGFCLDKNRQLKTNHRYYSQIQVQMYVTRSAYCDLFVFLEHDSELVRISYDSGFVDQLLGKASEFFVSSVLPELLTRKLFTHAAEKLPAADDSTTTTVELVCLCNQPAYGRMIKCNNDDCTMVWFHHACVNVKRARKTWYCPECKS